MPGAARYSQMAASATAGLAHQDWTVQTVRKRGKGGTAGADGAPTAARSGKGASGAGAQMKKLADATDVERRATIGLELRMRIQQARLSKGWSQKQLAQATNEKPAIINQYECGSVVPSNAVLGKLERCLGVKLRGKAAVTKGAKAKAGKAKR